MAVGEHSDDDMLELEGHNHLLTAQPVDGDRWTAMLAIFPEGRAAGAVGAALLTTEDCQALVEYLTKLLAAERSEVF